MRTAIIIFLIFSRICVASGQQTPQAADSISYSLFLKKDWKSLAAYGVQAATGGHDFYYLNLRTGIAFYQLGKLQKAKFSLGGW